MILADKIMNLRKKEFSEQHSRLNTLGTVLCILSVLPIFAALAFSLPDVWAGIGVCLLLLPAAFGCYAFVYGGVYYSAMDKLLRRATTRAKRRKKAPFSPL